MRCGTCGTEMSKIAKLCSNCGAVLWDNFAHEIEWTHSFKANKAVSVILKEVDAMVIIRPDRIGYDVKVGQIAKPDEVRVIHTGRIVAVYTDPLGDTSRTIIIEAPRSTMIEIEELKGSVHIDNLGQTITGNIVDIGFRGGLRRRHLGKHSVRDDEPYTKIGKH